jgi:hypothetical protein
MVALVVTGRNGKDGEKGRTKSLPRPCQLKMQVPCLLYLLYQVSGIDNGRAGGAKVPADT